LYYDVPFPVISIFTLLSFIEFLMDNNLSVPTVKNYISSIKSAFKTSNVSISAFESTQLTLALSSLSKNWRPPISIKPVISPSQFSQIIHNARRLPLHQFYVVSFLFGYMALLRISNVAPTSRSTFDPLRHLRRGDVSITTQGLCIHLRWTKTLQRHRQSARIHILSIPGSSLCPLAAFQSLQRSYPVHPTDPILSYRVLGQLFIISQSQIRRALKRLVLSLNLHPNISFHAFRHSGASLAFASGIPFQSIQSHGTWASDALWAYIGSDARDMAVPRFFSTVFSSF
jgi:integrase